MRGLIALLLLAGLTTQPLAQSAALRIVVIQGEDAVNIIQQKTAVAPVVEVRDRNNLPVASATVVFTINGSGATFGGAQALAVVTNAAGQATAAGLTPTAAGAINISATAAFQGQSATITIAQSNVMTAAEANLARGKAKSSGGGMSAGTLIGIFGGVAGAGAAVAVASKGGSSDPPASSQSQTGSNPSAPTGATPTQPTPNPNRAPNISSASITPNVALVGADTSIAFQAQASDPDDDPLTFLWEFPDGTTTDQRAFLRIFRNGGVHLFRVTRRFSSSTRRMAMSSWTSAVSTCCS